MIHKLAGIIQNAVFVSIFSCFQVLYNDHIAWCTAEGYGSRDRLSAFGNDLGSEYRRCFCRNSFRCFLRFGRSSGIAVPYACGIEGVFNAVDDDLSCAHLAVAAEIVGFFIDILPAGVHNSVAAEIIVAAVDACPGGYCHFSAFQEIVIASVYLCKCALDELALAVIISVDAEINKACFSRFQCIGRS